MSVMSPIVDNFPVYPIDNVDASVYLDSMTSEPLVPTTGQRISISHRDHGHIRGAQRKSFTGIVEIVGQPYRLGDGHERTNIVVRLEPAMKVLRTFTSDDPWMAL